MRNVLLFETEMLLEIPIMKAVFIKISYENSFPQTFQKIISCFEYNCQNVKIKLMRSK